MGQFTELVEKQGKKLAAEEWGRQVKTLHVHRLKSMWYDTRPQDTDEHSVTDIQYNSGIIERILHTGKVVHFGEQLYGHSLINAYVRHTK
jgi:hypothetical protein